MRDTRHGHAGILPAARLAWRYARGLPPFLRHVATSDECRITIRQALASRTEAFRRMVHEGIFAQAGSPYLPLLRHAGVTAGDVDELIRTEGIEGTLARLHEAGVYVTLEEFKGRRPIRRGSFEHHVLAEDFDNPLQSPQFSGVTGGSRGAPRRLLIDLGLVAHDAACYDAFADAWHLGGRPMAVWRPVPPDNSGLKKVLIRLKLGSEVERWFSQNALSWGGGHAQYAAFTHMTAFVARALGRPFPFPEHVPFERADVVARWIAGHVRAGRAPHVDTIVSSAVRVATVARQMGLPIHGTTFRVGSEPLTAAKALIVEQAGGRLAVHYSMSETGPVAMGCPRGETVDDSHVLESKVALTSRPRVVAAHAEPVNAIHLTTVAPIVPKLLLNVETGDMATVVRRSCGCPLGALGFDLRVQRIRSWEKLTGEGIAFLGTTFVTIVEDVLPQRLGGSPLDYQFVEEDEGGTTRVSLLVSPRIGAVDAADVTTFVLDHLATLDAGHRLMADLWRGAGTLRVVRREPFQTTSAKVLPLHHSERP